MRDVIEFPEERDVRRHRQMEALEYSAGAWSQADHPELENGSAEYVERIRAETDHRFEDMLERLELETRWPRSEKALSRVSVEKVFRWRRQ